MNNSFRVCLFFSEKSLTQSLRDFFLSQHNCLITDFFTDNHSFIRDISASRPHVVIIQFALMDANEKRMLQKLFPNTIIAMWADSKLDQEKFDHIIKMAEALSPDSFLIDEEALYREKNGTGLRIQKYLLTNRELQVLQLFANGKSHQNICDELNISYETIRTHTKHIYAKLEVKRINEAVSKAIREKLVE